jgi:signal transduction histidine kinase/ActR/RegA family two-component response regulator
MKPASWPLIRLRFLVPIAVLSLLLIATSFSVVYESAQREADYIQAVGDRFQAKLVNLSRTIELLGDSRHPVIVESLARISAAHHVDYVLLASGSGIIVQSTSAHWQGKRLIDVLPTALAGVAEEAMQTRSLLFRKLDGHRYVMVVSYSENLSMVLRNLDRGVVVLAFDLGGAMNDVRQKAILERLPDLLVWLFGGLLLMQFLNNWLTKPIEQLRREMIEGITGQTHLGTDPSGAWEVRSLAESFYGLRERLDGQFKQLEISRADAEKASRAKSEFLASMSHELRTPLNIILGYCQILAENDSIGEELRGQIKEVDRASNHLLALVSDIMDLSRIEAGKLRLNRSVFCLMDVLEETRAIALVYAKERNIQVRLYNETIYDNVLLEADPTRVRQVLINLLTNAIKYGPSDAFVDVRVTCPEAEVVRIEVRDFGPGISVEMRSRLFADPFDRLGRELSAVEGVGIGLVVCSRLIAAMGGQIGQRNALDGGAIFWIEIPGVLASFDDGYDSSEDPAVETSGRLDVHELNDLKGKRILVAEDNLINQKMMLLILGKEGCVSHSVANGHEAVEAYKRNSFDLVLMDCQMPVMDGYAATCAIRKFESESGRPRTPVIAITANALEGDAQRAVAVGMDAYMTKPIKLSELRKILRGIT